jgi:cobalt-factor III methyltransferase
LEVFRVSGVLNLVSVGPGTSNFIVPRAIEALRASDVIVSYELYLSWVTEWIQGKEIHTPPLTRERERARLAIDRARAGKIVALISSGDIGIYAMAALAFEEMSEEDTFDVNVIPGITAANACASLLGSPLSHDFAILSLSNLMCPWEWIEQRARHIATADLACVLYNVQSNARVEGVYRVLSILQEHKSPETLCGVVRNAYRPDQSVEIRNLRDLPAMQFDMLTTIVIGNRFTRRKRGWIFTPRGYNDWTTDVAGADVEIPSAGVWVFSGTSDGNALARELANNYRPIVVSTASEYGGEIVRERCPGVTVWSGRQGVEARRRALRASSAVAIVDATHPYAQVISEQLIGLAEELAIPYFRYERPGVTDGQDVLWCESAGHAAERAISLGKRIFLATGSKDLATFLQAPNASSRQWFVRITPEPAVIRRAIDLGIPRDRILAMQGPFSESFNHALWRDQGIDCVVTKDSGETGGFAAKARAAAALRIPLLVIRRPKVAYPRVVTDFESLGVMLRDLGSPRLLARVDS